MSKDNSKEVNKHGDVVKTVDTVIDHKKRQIVYELHTNASLMFNSLSSKFSCVYCDKDVALCKLYYRAIVFMDDNASHIVYSCSTCFKLYNQSELAGKYGIILHWKTGDYRYELCSSWHKKTTNTETT